MKSLLLALSLIAVTAAAQRSSTMHPPAGFAPLVTGAPYSADQVSENTQTLPDGTHVTQKSPAEHYFRDSAGRTRTERVLYWNASRPEDIGMLIQIDDPVAGFVYILDTQKQIAYRYAVRPPRPFPPAPTDPTPRQPPRRTLPGSAATRATEPRSSDARHPNQSDSTSESLGTQVIEGVIAEGLRSTTTHATGTVGNDQPFSSTRETWTSPELKLVLITRNDDPRYGQSTTRLTNISRNEPEAALFQPPPDYKIVDRDKTEPVTIVSP